MSKKIKLRNSAKSTCKNRIEIENGKRRVEISNQILPGSQSTKKSSTSERERQKKNNNKKKLKQKKRVKKKGNKVLP